jgi:Ser/Thr protein kinase RdoA (MazF antagonist)
MKKMIENPLENNSLICFYQQQLNLLDHNFHPIEHEDAIVATVYEVSQPSGAKYILKICHRPTDYLCEIYFLKYFADKIPVPRIVNIIEATSNTPGAILMECIDGELLSSSALTNNLAREIGLNLAKIHTNKVNGFGDLTQSQDLSHDPTSYFSFKFNEGITECNEHLPISLLEQCQQYYFDNLHLLNETDGPCIVHRDYRPGNLIVCNGKLNGIIDWSSARASFAEEDFCSIVLSELWNEISHKNAFLEGYASVRPVPNYSRIMPLLLLSKSIATLGFTVKTKTWDNKNATLYQKHRQLLESIVKKADNEN